MAQAMVNFRMDENLKRDMETICKEMGLTATAAYTLFAKKVTQDRRIPFEITADPFYNAQNKERLRRNIADIKAGRNISEHELIEVN
jgi:DNA-damage-inducible protein J